MYRTEDIRDALAIARLDHRSLIEADPSEDITCCSECGYAPADEWERGEDPTPVYWVVGTDGELTGELICEECIMQRPALCEPVAYALGQLEIQAARQNAEMERERAEACAHWRATR